MRLSFIKRVGAHARNKSGATALEFAMVGPIFFMLMFGIIEAGAVYIGEATLQFGVNDMARQIRTGQVETAKLTKTEFRDQLCAKISPYLPCDSNLQIDVQQFNDFSGADFASPIDTATGDVKSSLNNFQIGAACQVVLIRSFYKWKVITPLFTPFLVNMSGDRRLISGAAAFRNEPYSSGVSGCS